VEQEKAGRGTSRLLEETTNEATMAWTQLVAVETEGKRADPRKSSEEQKNNSVKH
jgi:hypothetical protein